MEGDYSLANTIFKDHLIAKKLFRFLDRSTLKAVRLLCKNSNDIAFKFLSKSDNKLYIKFEESSGWSTEQIVKSQNLSKLIFFEEYFISEEKSWVVQNLEIPVKEGLECPNLRHMLKSYGNLIKNLRIVRKFDGKESCGRCSRPWKILNKECSNVQQFIRCILNDWCHNLTSVAIIDYTTNLKPFPSLAEENNINQTKLTDLVFECIFDESHNFPEDYLPLGIKKMFVHSLIKSSPLLEHLSIIPSRQPICTLFSQWIGATTSNDPMVKKPFDGIKSLALGFMDSFRGLGIVTETNFPRLTTLKLNTEMDSLGNSTLSVNPFNHSGVKEIHLIFNSMLLEGSSVKFDNIVLCFPHAKNVRLSFRRRNGKLVFLPLCDFLFGSRCVFPLIEQLTVDAGFPPCYIPQMLRGIASMFPNLEKLDFGWIMLACEYEYEDGGQAFGEIGQFPKLKELGIRLTRKNYVNEEILRNAKPDLISAAVHVDENEYCVD